ncbi:protein kinase [Candidatus Uabimicrobium sp. HlEnr_7]|uniref:protein kinase domain-containing protein n=1 Tax=Candidatus Uabimicrobium helgolandensis TaxID=3095367 RepID=UPI0035579849
MNLLHVTKASTQNAHQKLTKMAETLQKINHRNFQKIYSVEQDDNNYYLVLEAVSGNTLSWWLQQQTLSISQTTATIYQLLDGIFAGHNLGIIHQAIHPKNIFLQKNGHVKIMMYGLNLSKGMTGFEPQLSNQQSEKNYKISENEAYHFWSPELYQGEQLDERSDIFSIGVLFYYLLTKQYPFGQQQGISYLNHMLKNEPTSIQKYLPDINPQLQTIITKMLQKKKEQRYQNVQQVLEDLSNILDKAAKKLVTSDSISPKINTKTVEQLTVKTAQDKRTLVQLLSLAYQSTSNAHLIKKKLFHTITTQKNDTDYLLDIYHKITLRGLRNPSKLYQSITKIKTLLENSDTSKEQLEKFIEQNILYNLKFFDSHDNNVEFNPITSLDITSLESESSQDEIFSKQSESNTPPNINISKPENSQEQSESNTPPSINISEPENSQDAIISQQSESNNINTSETKSSQEQSELSTPPNIDIAESKGSDTSKPESSQEQSESNTPPSIEIFEPKNPSSKKRHRKLGAILISLDIINRSQLKNALAYQQEYSVRLGEALILLNYATEIQVYQALARQNNLPYVDLSTGDIPPEVIECAPRQIVEEKQIIPVKKTARAIYVAFSDVTDLETLEDLRFLLACDIELVVATPTSIAQAIKKHYDVEQSNLEDMYDMLTSADLGYDLDDEIEYAPVKSDDADYEEDDDDDDDGMNSEIVDECDRSDLREIASLKRRNYAKKSYDLDKSTETKPKVGLRKKALKKPSKLETETQKRQQALKVERKEKRKITIQREKSWQKWLSGDAGIPGPVERFTSKFKVLLKISQATIGMYFVLFANAVDMIIDTVSSYVQGIFRAWKMAHTMKKAARRTKDPSILVSELWSDYNKARALLYRLLYNSSTTKKQITKLDKYQRDIVLTLVLEARYHLDQMRRDLDFVNRKETLATGKKTILDFLLSFIPNPLSVFTPIKDFFVLVFCMKYSREDINYLHCSFLHDYHSLIVKLEIEHKIDNIEHIPLDHEDNIRKQYQLPTQENIDKVISHSRETLHKMICALCKADTFFSSQKWSLNELVNEINRRKKNCDPLLILDLEIRLSKLITKTLQNNNVKFDATEKQQQISEQKERHYSLNLQKKLTKLFI